MWIAVESPAYNFSYKTGCIPLRKQACSLQLFLFCHILYLSYLQNYTGKYFETYKTCSSTKRGQVIAPDGAAALFERGGPRQTAKRDLYICRPNISSQQLYSLYLGTTLVQELFLKYAKFWDVPPRQRNIQLARLVHTDVMGLAPRLHKNW